MPRRKLSQSPQARWSRKQKKRGNCSRCGNQRNRYRQLCDRCQSLTTEYMRQYRAARKTTKETTNAPDSSNLQASV